MTKCPPETCRMEGVGRIQVGCDEGECAYDDAPQAASETPRTVALLSECAGKGDAITVVKLVALSGDLERELTTSRAEVEWLQGRMKWSFEQPDGTKLSIADMCNIVPELRAEAAQHKRDAEHWKRQHDRKCEELADQRQCETRIQHTGRTDVYYVPFPVAERIAELERDADRMRGFAIILA